MIFVPLTEPDEIAGPIEYLGLRRRVDRRLRTMLRGDDLGLLEAGPRVLEVFGPPGRRAADASSEIGMSEAV